MVVKPAEATLLTARAVSELFLMIQILTLPLRGAVASKYRNAGQTCVCSNRIYVQDAVYDEFVTKFAAKVATVKVGNGFEEGVSQGPLIDDAALAKVEEHVKDAVSKGGRVVVGGNRISGRFFAPTVVADANANMRCAVEETFGPFAPVFRFQTEQEVIDAANDTIFGLASYLYSRDIVAGSSGWERPLSKAWSELTSVSLPLTTCLLVA